MKVLLFFLLFVFFAPNSWGQNNTNNNSTQEESLKEKENALKKNSNKVEEVIVPSSLESPTSTSTSGKFKAQPAQKDATSAQSSFLLKKSKFIARQSEFNHQRTQRTFSNGQQTELENLLREVAMDPSATYESLFFYYTNGQYDLSRSTALLKAYEMNPNDNQIKKEMVIYYFLTNKTDEFRTGLINLFNANVFPQAVKEYGTDLVNSVGQNGILITHGTEDSFSALYAQRVLRKREDIRIICLDWLNSPQFRSQLEAQQIRLPKSNFIDVNYLKEFCALNVEKGVSLSLTIPREYFSPILNQMYITGLVFDYKQVPTDNSLANESLWRTILNKKLLETRNHDLVLNYIPMMMQISRFYENQYETTSKLEMDAQIDQILQSRGKSLRK
ncbi:MAG: hypothetical protein WC044_09080 [Crocinitomicaceae bacterium]